MKKKLLATGVAVALGALSGVASAAITANAGGVGQINILPYYSVQEGNDTLISITNTDTVNGKAVKVRFRGAEWSDDVFDFQIFLSPGDMWTGAVTKDGNLAKLSTSDSTCTLPASVNQTFVPIRLQAAAQNTGTLEGYVEVITMADIPPKAVYGNAVVGVRGTTNDAGAAANPLYTAIKHVANGAPPCRTNAASQQLLEGLEQDNALAFAAGAAGGGTGAALVDVDTAAEVALLPGSWKTTPTSSLTTFATIVNVPTSKAFTFPAAALVEDAPVKQYFKQSNDLLAFSANLTSDLIFAARGAADGDWGGTALPMYQFDMPDLSTPTNTANVTAVAQRNALVAQLAKANVRTEYVTNDGLMASTDVVLSQPLRRYHYEYQRLASAATAFNLLVPDSTGTENKYNVRGDQLTVYSGLNGTTNRIAVGNPTFYDREENTFVGSSGIVISPTPPSAVAAISLKGEVSVVSINNSGLPTGALNASITANDYTATGNYADGWATLSTSSSGGAVNGSLPVIGFTAINLFNASAGANGTNYGMTLPLK